MRAVVLALTLALAGPAAAQTSDGNSGLERLTRTEQILTWKAVGRVDVGGSGYCTGTLIATDLVLTAAHCLYDANGALVTPESVTFRAGLADGTAVAEAKVSRAVAHPGYAQARPNDAGRIRHDAALLQLVQPIPAALAPPFTVTEPGEGDEVSVVSYGRGRDEALSWQRRCRVLGRQGGLIAVDCDVTFGSSGAPVFDRSQGRARIVSLISAGGTFGERTVAFGMDLPRLVDELKAELRAGGAMPAAPAPVARRLGAGSAERAGGARFLRPPASTRP